MNTPQSRTFIKPHGRRIFHDTLPVVLPYIDGNGTIVLQFGVVGIHFDKSIGFPQGTKAKHMHHFMENRSFIQPLINKPWDIFKIHFDKPRHGGPFASLWILPHDRWATITNDVCLANIPNIPPIEGPVNLNLLTADVQIINNSRKGVGAHFCKCKFATGGRQEISHHQFSHTFQGGFVCRLGCSGIHFYLEQKIYVVTANIWLRVIIASLQTGDSGTVVAF
mmetsp:Transcript_11758/g.20460  ORF Transcript_11758/g.20460 Transcript_11758/m.20460 type:complete len:222 (+) Transcript_11758:682-1347(+)